MILGPACNHDLGILLRLPPPTAQTAAVTELSQRHQAIASMLDSMGDHEFYCASYASEDQPHVEGLLVTLADSLRAKERDILIERAEGKDITAHEISRRILHRLISSTNRRMHKGFPEMVTYLLRKPMEYCSHRFVTLYVFGVFNRAVKLMRGMGERTDLEQQKNERDVFKLHSKPDIHVDDYPFRPLALGKFPLYFFRSACVARPRLDASSMEWTHFLETRP